MFAGNWAKTAGWVVLPDAQAGAGWIFLALYIIPLTVRLRPRSALYIVDAAVRDAERDE